MVESEWSVHDTTPFTFRVGSLYTNYTINLTLMPGCLRQVAGLIGDETALANCPVGQLQAFHRHLARALTSVRAPIYPYPPPPSPHTRAHILRKIGEQFEVACNEAGDRSGDPSFCKAF